ncbi:unnamed protein product [Lota lota]
MSAATIGTFVRSCPNCLWPGPYASCHPGIQKCGTPCPSPPPQLPPQLGPDTSPVPEPLTKPPGQPL